MKLIYFHSVEKTQCGVVERTCNPCSQGLAQEGLEFKDSLSYVVRPYVKINKRRMIDG